MTLFRRLRSLLAAAAVAFTCATAITLPATPVQAQTPATTAAAEPAHETVDNPYGLDALWKAGDIVARGTLAIMFVMSLGSWYLLITKFIEQSKLARQGRQANEMVWQAPSLRQGARDLPEGSAYRFLAESGIDAAAEARNGAGAQVGADAWVQMALQRTTDTINARLQDGLAFLGTVGSTSPFVGLFGTVWGIYHALTAIGIAGQASIDKVAGPVGESLIMTAIGLAVAVPAVLGYNWLVRRNKALMEQVRGFAADVHLVINGGNARGATKARATTAATAKAG